MTALMLGKFICLGDGFVLIDVFRDAESAQALSLGVLVDCNNR